MPNPNNAPQDEQPKDADVFALPGIDPGKEYDQIDLEWALENKKMSAVNDYMDGRATKTEADQVIDDAEQVKDILRQQAERAQRGSLWDRTVGRIVHKAKVQ